jgi:hypothetical protein
MIERDEAAGYLTRLAAPTMEAFTEARQQYAAHREAMAELRGRMAAPVSAVIDGINYWGPFATFLDERYQQIDGVARVSGTHPLAHRWTIDERIVLQLKSDTGNLPLEQLVLPNMPKQPNSTMEPVVLTWDHDHVDRFAPTFVRLDGRNEVWRLPVASLVESTPQSIRPPAPKSTVSSKRSGLEEQPTEVDQSP